MIYFEYSPFVVERGDAPGPLCYMIRKSIQDPFKGGHKRAAMAERIFEVRGNKVIELKNRYTGNFKESYISNEEKVVLVLRAVLI